MQTAHVFGAAMLGALAASPLHAASTPFWLGAYMGDPNDASSADEAAFEANYTTLSATLGTAPALITSYIDYTQPVSSWVGNSTWEANSHARSPDARTLVPVIGLPMASIAGGSPSPDAQFQSFASGQYDSVLAGIVQVWAQNGFHQLIFRPGWEMNIEGNTYAGADAQSRADWVNAFRHIYTVMHQAGATYGAGVQIVWNPNATNYDTNDTRGLYPGDAFVDIIGVDGYADMYPYTDSGTYHDWHTGQQDSTLAQFMADPVNRAHYWSFPAADMWSNDGSGGHNLSLSVLIAFARQHRKPFAVPETGAGNCNNGHDVCDDPTYPIWLSNRLSRAAANGLTISFVNIWNSNGGGNYEFSFTGDNKPREAAAWHTAFGPK